MSADTGYRVSNKLGFCHTYTAMESTRAEVQEKYPDSTIEAVTPVKAECLYHGDVVFLRPLDDIPVYIVSDAQPIASYSAVAGIQLDSDHVLVTVARLGTQFALRIAKNQTTFRRSP